MHLYVIKQKLKLLSKKFLEDNKADGFVNTFEDLYGMDQLPGLATQDLTGQGYGFGPEGDWKNCLPHCSYENYGTGR